MSRHGPFASASIRCTTSAPTSTVRRPSGQALVGSAVGSPGLATVIIMVQRSGPLLMRSAISCSRKSGARFNSSSSGRVAASIKEAVCKGTVWGLRKEAAKPGWYFWLKGGKRAQRLAAEAVPVP